MDGVIKITDFGLSRIYDFYTLLTSVVVTLWYRSPEVLMGQSYATPVDIWSCGCILAELYTRKPLFDGKSDPNQLSKIFEVLGTPSDENWPENAPVLKSNFVCMPKKAFSDVVPGLDPLAEDLLEVGEHLVLIRGRGCPFLIAVSFCYTTTALYRYSTQ